MPTIISGSTGVNQVTDNTLVVADAKSGQAVGFNRMQLFAAQNATGTAIDFTGIPSWAKKITVILRGCSVSGSSNKIVQLGTGSTPQTTAYSDAGSNHVGTTYTHTSGIGDGISSASTLVTGSITFTNLVGNGWIGCTALAANTGGFMLGCGAVTLSGPLDILRLTTVNGTDTFDAGSVSILVEGYE